MCLATHSISHAVQQFSAQVTILLTNHMQQKSASRVCCKHEPEKTALEGEAQSGVNELLVAQHRAL